MNTNWEYFTYNDERYKRRYFQGLYWMKREYKFPSKAYWRNVYEISEKLEGLYQEFILIEQREKKLERILNDKD